MIVAEKGTGRGVQPIRARFVGGVTAAARPVRETEAARHLVIAYRPGWQSLEDAAEIAAHVYEIDPSIRTFVLPTTAQNRVSRKQAATRPTLVVSNGRMPVFRPQRGKVYQGNPLPKIEEVRRLSEAGLPVPRTALLTPNLRLDPAEWGEFIVLKPTDLTTSSAGLGFQLMRTHRVRYIAPEDYPQGHPGRHGPMIVQQFISVGGYLSTYRVLTLFGEPLYLARSVTRTKVIDLDAPDEVIEAAKVAHQSIEDIKREFVSDPDVLALARRVHDAMPEIPLKGCDLMREVGTGKIYVIEVNSRGNTWHFSSGFQARQRKKNGAEFEFMRRHQFDAMRTAARVLVERTNAEAV